MDNILHRYPLLYGFPLHVAFPPSVIPNRRFCL